MSARGVVAAIRGPVLLAVGANVPLISDGNMTGSAGASDTLSGSLVTDNDNAVGEGGFGGTLSYDADLGAVAAAGLDASDFSLQYTTGFGGELLFGQVNVVPEPSTLALLSMGTLGLLMWASRRRKRTP